MVTYLIPILAKYQQDHLCHLKDGICYCLTEYLFKGILTQDLLGGGTCFSFFHSIMLIIKLFVRLPVSNSKKGWGLIIIMGVLPHILH